MRVSCICVAGEFPGMLPRAVRSFLVQTHADRELVVAYRDDDAESAKFLAAYRSDPRVVPLSLSAAHAGDWDDLRNAAFHASNGHVVFRWDACDWSAPRRVEAQLAGLTGDANALAGQPVVSEVVRVGRRSPRPLAASVCGRRRFFRAYPFPHRDIAALAVSLSLKFDCHAHPCRGPGEAEAAFAGVGGRWLTAAEYDALESACAANARPSGTF